MTPADVKACREQAAYYRARGFNPLPSRMDEKRPMLARFAHLWEAPLPASEFERHETANLQVMTGRAWGLVVIDLDGAEAVELWAEMGEHRDTWVSHSGGGGRHVWFRVDRDGPPLPKAVLWKGEGGHSAIERLGDRSLVMAPPSIHPRTGRRYRWLDKRHSPFAISRPIECPPWVLRLAPARPAPLDAERPVVLRPGRAGGPRVPWRELVAGLDVPALVRSWGVRTVGSPRRTGWLPCHAVGRVDARPSAAVHVESGFYVDSGSGLRLGLVDLAVALGAYATADEAVAGIRGLAR